MCFFLIVVIYRYFNYMCTDFNWWNYSRHVRSITVFFTSVWIRTRIFPVIETDRQTDRLTEMLIRQTYTTYIVITKLF